jgi:hypothetical protein
MSTSATGAEPERGEPAAWPYGPTMVDPELDRLLRDEGWCVVDMVEGRALAELADACWASQPADPVGFTSTFFSPDADLKRRVHAAIGTALGPGLERHFVDHHSILHSFTVNWPGPGGGLQLHQHSSMVDERRFRSAIVWCAVNDATEENGTLHVVPRSHLLQQGPRPERSQSWCEDHVDALLAGHLRAVPLRAGQALVFDNQLLHVSFGNHSTGPRASAVAGVVPRAAEPLYYELDGDDSVNVYRLDPEFFLTTTAQFGAWPEPEDLVALGTQPWRRTVVSTADVDALPAGGCTHRLA